MPFSETAPTVAHSRKLIQDVVDDHIGGGGTTTDVENFLATEALISVGGDMSVTGSTSLGQGQQVMTTGAQVFSGDKNFTGSVIIGDPDNPVVEPTTLTIVHKDGGGHITTGERIGGIDLAGVDNSDVPQMRTGVKIYGEATGGWGIVNAAPAKLVVVCETGNSAENTSPCFEMSDTGNTSLRDFTVDGAANVAGDLNADGSMVLGTETSNIPTPNGVTLASLDGSDISFVRDNANIINAGDKLGSIVAYGRDAGYTRKGAEIRFSARLGYTDSIPRPTRARSKIGFHVQDGLEDDGMVEPRVSISDLQMACDVPFECSEAINAGSTLDVSGVTTLGDVTVTGTTNLNGDFYQNGTLVDLTNVAGVDWNTPKTFGAAVTVQGTTTLNGTVSVPGQSTFTGTTNLNGVVKVSGTQVSLLNTGPFDANITKNFVGGVTMQSDLEAEGVILVGTDVGEGAEHASTRGQIFQYGNPHPIAPLLPASQSGLAIVGPENQHVCIQIRANGDEDSFSVISNLTGSTNDPKTPDANLFRVERTGNTFLGVSDEIVYTQASKTLDVTSGATLDVNGALKLNGVEVTATAAQLNSAGSGNFDPTADITFSGYTKFTGGVKRNSRFVSANYQIVGADQVLICNNSSAITVTLPNPFSGTVQEGAEFVILTTNTGGVTVNVHDIPTQRILKLNGNADTSTSITGQGKMVRYFYTGIGTKEWVQAVY